MDIGFNEQCFKAHNHFRSLHGCLPLQFDPSLARDSQEWAELLASKGTLKHSSLGSYGENLAFRSSTGKASYSGEEATQMWYDEISRHDFNNPAPQRSGHFTQLIWKNTTHAGFGRACTKDGHAVYVVGRYTPPGNYRGQYKENVPQLIKTCSASIAPAPPMLSSNI